MTRIQQSAILRIPLASAIIFFGLGIQGAVAEFLNLDFEDAIISGPSPQFDLTASQVVPFWNAPDFEHFYQHFAYDTIALDAPCISVHDVLDELGFRPLQGNYSITMQNGMAPPEVGTWLSQTAVVPTDARSLMFCTDLAENIDLLEVSFNGTPIPMHLYSVGGFVNEGRLVETYIGDVSSFSGQEGELRFDLASYPHTIITLDAIELSPIVSPEPNSLMLLVIAGIVMAVVATIGRWKNVTCTLRQSPSVKS